MYTRIKVLLSRLFLTLSKQLDPVKPTDAAKPAAPQLNHADVLNLLGIKGFRDDMPYIPIPEEKLDTWFLTCDKKELVKYERVQRFLRKVANGKL